MKGGKCVYGAYAPKKKRNEDLPKDTPWSCPRAGAQPPCCDGRDLDENTRTEGLANWRKNRGRFCHFNEQIIQSYWNEKCHEWRRHRSAANKDRFEADANACKGTAMREAGAYVQGMRGENKAYHDKEKKAEAFCGQGQFQNAVDAYKDAETMRNEWVKKYFRESLLAACKTCDADCNNHEYAAKTCASLSADNEAKVLRATNPELGAFVVKTAAASQGEEDEENPQERQRRRELKQFKEAEEKKAAEEAAAKGRSDAAEESARRKAEQGAAAAAAATEQEEAETKENNKQALKFLTGKWNQAKKALRELNRAAPDAGGGGGGDEEFGAMLREEGLKEAKAKVKRLKEARGLLRRGGDVNQKAIEEVLAGLKTEKTLELPAKRRVAVALLRATGGDVRVAYKLVVEAADQGGGAGGYKKRRRTRKKRRRRRKTRRRRQRKSRRRTRRR